MSDENVADDEQEHEVTTEFPSEVDGRLTAVGMAQKLSELTGVEFTPAEVLEIEDYGWTDFDTVVIQDRVFRHLDEIVHYLAQTGELTNQQLVAVVTWVVNDLGYPVSSIGFEPDEPAHCSQDPIQLPVFDDVVVSGDQVDLAALIVQARETSARLSAINFS